ncbi:hypothetical protein SeLEV6574_g02440 [Synchytrium endobioticum]|uniref:Uncharacterized protein n=1 Tax=Synchytrium endobioticum TaxID=286115 RepID=A0A507D8Z3_9FUNG|nr:hypothetical protein SeLEV6574_g02440 [Synchytrium endobioticum]
MHLSSPHSYWYPQDTILLQQYGSNRVPQALWQACFPHPNIFSQTLPQFLFNVRRIGPTNVPKLIRDMRNAVHMQKMKFTAQQMLKII